MTTRNAEFRCLDGQTRSEVLCRLHGRPLGFVHPPVRNGGIHPADVWREVLDRHHFLLAVALARTRIGSPASPLDANALAVAPAIPVGGPLVTVAVCTRDRAGDLAMCLKALCMLTYERVDLLVVDNAPSSDETQRLVREQFPRVRYVREPRPGLDWARNRAILECHGDLLAYTDDDVIVDPGWVEALVRVFLADPAVMAVTGLVIPHELETEAQQLFERYGGFGRGFARRWYRAPPGESVARVHGGTGKFGTGANMAFRRDVFSAIGGFDPALDVGTCTNGGGDLEMLFRVLKAGHMLVYEPAAMVRHRHRRTYAQLRTQIANNGVGFYSYLVRSARAYPDERAAFIRLGLWWFYWWSLRRLGRALLGKSAVPVDLIFAEIVGSIRGLRRYQRASVRAQQLRTNSPNEPLVAEPPPSSPTRACRLAEAVRTVDVTQPLQPIDDVADYHHVRVIVSQGSRLIGMAAIEHQGAVINETWLADAISEQIAQPLLDPEGRHNGDGLHTMLRATLARALNPAIDTPRFNLAPPPLGDEAAVTIIVATYDRPSDLRRCLTSLTTQHTARQVQIVVVDNHPISGMTREVLRDFPQVLCVEESRGGLSYARNRGIAAATGDIIVCTDDDVTCPPDWVERLIAPFARPEVMVVTGNVLPASLNSEAERLFESYGGLGRGFKPFAVGRSWFEHGRRAVPTWHLGCTANAAFRACVFADPAIGLMDEALGAGTPTGCSEDTLVFYRVLKAGFTIVYEPSAYVWHRHRATLRALHQQIYSYSKGHVAYHLTTWLHDGDRRGLIRVLYELPRTHAQRVYHRLRGWTTYPLSMIAIEVLGHLAGPLALWRSRRRVRRLGRSAALPSSVPATGTPADAGATS